MGVRTSAGTNLRVCAALPATHDAAGFAALSWKTVGEVVDLGEFGRRYNLVRHNPLATRGTQKMKGSYDEGSISLQLGLDNSDQGQIVMKTARDSDLPVSIEITLQNGDKYYATVLVMGFVVGVGTVDQVTSATADMELTSDANGDGVVEVLADAA